MSASPLPVDDGRDWSSMDKDLLGKIANEYLNAIEHACFRLVCSSWRASSPVRPIKLPLLILCDRHLLDQQAVICFYDINDNQIINLPKATIEVGSYFCGSSHGWLAFLDPSTRINLQNPITGELIILPKTTEEYRRGDLSFQYRSRQYRPIKVVLSAAPTDPNCIIAVMWRGYGQIDICRTTNLKWKTLKCDYIFQDMVFYKGDFFVCCTYDIFKLNLDFDPNRQITLFPLSLHYLVGFDYVRSSNLLVFNECLLLVLENYPSDDQYRIFKVDFEYCWLESFEDERNPVIFLGQSDGITMNSSRVNGCRGDSFFLRERLMVHQGYNGEFSLLHLHGREKMWLSRKSDDRSYPWVPLGWMNPRIE